MENSAWGDTFEIGNDYIDAQHGMLVTLIGKLSRTIESDAPAERLRRLLQEIKKYAEFHFISEENFMHEIDYAGRDAHEKAHSHLLSELSLRISRVKSGKGEAAAVLEFLRHWLVVHIAQEDRDFVEQARAHALDNPGDEAPGSPGSGSGRLRGKVVRRAG